MRRRCVGLGITQTDASSRIALGSYGDDGSAGQRGSGPWRDFEASFQVPATDCGAQWLVLRLPARIPAEQRIGGRAWFDTLKISRTRPSN